MKKDVTIQISRATAMILIILCHIVQEFDNKFIVMTAQIFNLGVYMFLLISGFLYSNKEVNIKKFYKDRFLKIMIPVYIFMIPVFILELFNKTFDIRKLVIYLFDIQGIFGGVIGANHLWFLTAIGICYLLLPVFQFIKNKKNWHFIFNIILVILTSIICFLNRTLGIIFICICTYSFGYFYFRKIYALKIKPIALALMLIGDFIVRIILKYFWDGTVIYDLIVVGITQVIASIIIILIIKMFDTNKIKNLKIINTIDKYSFYIYITHYFFIKGQASVMKITPYLSINIFLMLLLTILYSILLLNVCNFINKKIGGKKCT